MAYSDKVVEHAENPKNVGTLDKNDPSVGTGLVGAPACGDVMRLQIKVGEGGVIEDAKFKTFGCGSAIASSSLATEWIKGKTVDEAEAIKNVDIVKELEKVQNRRKAVIYVSNGYDFNPFPEGRLGEDPVFGGRFGEDREENRNDPTMQQSRQGQQFADADLVRELAELTRTANRANATLYTIDPRGLVGGPDLDEQLDPVEWNNYVRKSQDSLRVLADETGGIAVVNQNDFDKALKRIDAETSDYYVLGYYSSNPDPTIRTRKLEVKVKRPDIQVWSRKAYSLKAKPTSSAEKR